MTDADDPSQVKPVTWHTWLGLNSSTLALLGTILLVTSATELWSPLIPQFLKTLRLDAAGGNAWTILLIGLYGFYRDFLEAVNYYVGGAIAARFNTRRALLLFNFLPLLGLLILLLWPSVVGLFVAIPFIFVWNSLAGPATIRVVGDSVPAARRTIAFSMQSIFRRVSRVLAYGISAPMILWLGEYNGVRADIGISIGLLLLAMAIQFRLMKTASRDATGMVRQPLRLLRSFQPELRRLLLADIFARWAEGLTGPFIILFCIPLLAAETAKGMAIYQSILLTIQAVTSMLLYVFIGPLASREGLAKKPYIGLTFLFFALFPVSLAILGPTLGFWGLALAFVIGGFQEIGEPARKAMIADLVPNDVRTQAIGLYWSARSVAVMAASPIGAVIWILGESVRGGLGPMLTFGTAGFVGMFGAAMFFWRFGRGSPHQGSLPS